MLQCRNLSVPQDKNINGTEMQLENFNLQIRILNMENHLVLMLPSCVFSHEVLAKIARWFGLVGVSPLPPFFFFPRNFIIGLLELEQGFAKAPCDELGITDLTQ